MKLLRRIINKNGLEIADLLCIMCYWFAAVLPLILEIYYKQQY
jgi:hypothetical protein